MTRAARGLESRSWRYLAEAPAALPSWGGALPTTRGAERGGDPALLATVHQALRAVGPQLGELAEAIRQWWPLRPRHPTGFELVVVHPDGTREKHQIHHRVLRIGRDASCPLQLRSEVISSEHCEIRVDDTRLWLVDLASSNGTRLDEKRIAAWEPRVLEAGNRIEVGPFRLVVGQTHARYPEPAVAVMPVSVELHHGAFPAGRLGGADSPWVEVATAPSVGGWAAWVRLPTTWLRAARGAVAEAPPITPTEAFDTPLDYAITSHLLSRIAATFESRTGTAVTVATPQPQAALLASPPRGERFVIARCEVTVGDAAWLVDAVWPPPTQQARATRIADGLLGALPMPVAIIVGAISLSPADLAGIDRGDIVVPDKWYPENWVEDADADLGQVELRVQSWTATARLGFAKGFFHLELKSAWTVRPKGDAMPPTDDDRRDDTAEHDLAAGDPARIADELEVTVAFELERIPVPLRELAEWREGGLVRLDRRAEDPLRVVLHHGGTSRLLGYGRVIVVDERLGIQIDRWLGDGESR